MCERCCAPRWAKMLGGVLLCVAGLIGCGAAPGGGGVAPPPDNGGDTPVFSKGLAPTPAAEYNAIALAEPRLTFGAGGLPDRVDLRESGRLPTPGAQGGQGSCSAWACGYGLKSYQEAVEGNYTPTGNTQAFSPAFLYYFTNASAGDPQQCINAGVVTIKVVMDMLKTRGVCTLATMPYNDQVCATAPPEAALTEAKRYLIRDYSRLDSLQGVKQQLSQGNPVIIGILVGSNFEQAAGPFWTTDQYNADTTSGGGHAFLIVGYDDAQQALIVMNSWGTGWGNAGFWQIAYDVLPSAQANNFLELWVAEDVVTDEPVAPPVEPDSEEDTTVSGEITITRAEFGLGEMGKVTPRAQLAAGVSVEFDVEFAAGLQNQEAFCALIMLDADTGDILTDRDGMDEFFGLVGSWGSLYLSESLSYSGMSLFLPESALDLPAGSYSLIPALVVGTEDNDEIAYVTSDEIYSVFVDTDQVDEGDTLFGYYSGLDSDGWFVDFAVESGTIFGGITEPDMGLYFPSVGGDVSGGEISMDFDLGAFKEGMVCTYQAALPGLDDIGEGTWQCNDGANGVWFFVSLGDFEDFDDWDDDYVYDFCELDGFCEPDCEYDPDCDEVGDECAYDGYCNPECVDDLDCDESVDECAYDGYCNPECVEDLDCDEFVDECAFDGYCNPDCSDDLDCDF